MAITAKTLGFGALEVTSQTTPSVSGEASKRKQIYKAQFYCTTGATETVTIQFSMSTAGDGSGLVPIGQLVVTDPVAGTTYEKEFALPKYYIGGVCVDDGQFFYALATGTPTSTFNQLITGTQEGV